MTVWRSGALVLALAVLTVPPAYGGQATLSHSTLFAFDDDDIFESSGIVDRGGVVYTVNDSGDDAVVYGVDPGTGRTVSRTTYADQVSDVEALAPGQGGTVWAGDIGDNRMDRDDVSVYRLLPSDGDQPAQRYRLAYPDGAHDAEALLVHPRTGRVFVVTKSVLGGTVYAAPRVLDRDHVNRLVPFARVSGLVTDGTFYPDGRHVLLRTYRDVAAYTFPGFQQTGSARLPAQRQGEGISVSSTGRVLLSSEGVHADVLRVTLPAGFTANHGAPATAPPRRPPQQPVAAPRGARDWVGIALVGSMVALGGYLALRGSRVRPPRGR
jgi:hypothetical protein